MEKVVSEIKNVIIVKNPFADQIVDLLLSLISIFRYFLLFLAQKET